MAGNPIWRRIRTLSAETADEISRTVDGAVTDADVLAWLGRSEESAARVRGLLDAAISTAALRLAVEADGMADTLVELTAEGTTANESVRLAAATRGLELLVKLRKLTHERAEGVKSGKVTTWKLPEFPIRRDERPGHADPRVAISAVPPDEDRH